MTINRYEGNTGRFTRLPEPGTPPPPSGGPAHALPLRLPPRGPLSALDPARLLSGLGQLETEDLLLLLILYLLYRDSGDTELLIIMGALFLL